MEKIKKYDLIKFFDEIGIVIKIDKLRYLVEKKKRFMKDYSNITNTIIGEVPYALEVLVSSGKLIRVLEHDAEKI